MSNYTIGSDEVGYGALAGPLYVCAYLADYGWTVPGLDDSKKLSPEQRRKVYANLDLSRAVIKSVDSVTIDRVGVFKALISAHTQAIHELQGRGYLSARVVVDGALKLPLVPNAEAIPKADSTVPAVMAASIIAKVNRDHFMEGLAELHPFFFFHMNKGYGVPPHIEALKRMGPTEYHRMSYRPVKDIVNDRQRLANHRF